MISIAQLNPDDRADLFDIAAGSMGVQPAIIEKDFWVCYLLDYLFARSTLKDRFIFKGGTSLSKCYQLIQRFSEDVDMILDWRVLGYGLAEPWEERSNNKQSSFKDDSIIRTNRYLREVFIPVIGQGISQELGFEAELSPADEEETVIFKYPRYFNQPGIQNVIRLEIGPLAAWSPSESVQISSYLAQQIPDVIPKPIFEVNTVKPERTFWEKVTILHQEANRPENKMIPPRYSRHYYDVYQLGKSWVKQEAIGKIELLGKVVRFKEKFYRTPWSKLSEAKPGTLKLVPPQMRYAELKRDYEAMKTMLMGDVPEISQIFDFLSDLEDEINAKQ